MKQTDNVPHRRGWVFGSWQRDGGEFRVAIFHEESGTGARAHGRTREDAVADAQRIIDAIYEERVQALGFPDGACTILR